MVTSQHILYLHGFNSSSLSWKAQALLGFMQKHELEHAVTVADIPAKPSEASHYLLTLAQKLVQDYEVSFVGSSLGGFYATWLAEQFNCKAVLINPAVKPHERLQEYLGENKKYHSDETWEFTEADLLALQSMCVDTVNIAANYLVLLQTGDETLDYRQAESFYAGTNLEIEQGGDHAFQGFDSHLHQILGFCGFQQFK